MRPLCRTLFGIVAATALTVACGGPGLASVSGIVEGSYACGAASTCRQPIGIQSLTFRSDVSSQPARTTRSDASGRFSIELPAGTWTAYVGGGAVRVEARIQVYGFPGERLTINLSIGTIPVGAG